jgi:hypothetical protein
MFFCGKKDRIRSSWKATKSPLPIVFAVFTAVVVVLHIYLLQVAYILSSQQVVVVGLFDGETTTRDNSRDQWK